MVQLANDLRCQLRWDDLPDRNVERRRFQRWPLAAPAKLAMREREAIGRCLDVSLGGALLEDEAETPLPSQLLLYLTLSTAGATPLAVLARVIEVRRRRVRVS
ncbi:MAG: PilZ domain-containing protein, partial [Deltaproteobacteria bacterium]